MGTWPGLQLRVGLATVTTAAGAGARRTGAAAVLRAAAALPA
jgi:hypothetical protein